MRARVRVGRMQLSTQSESVTRKKKKVLFVNVGEMLDAAANLEKKYQTQSYTLRTWRR